jgi:hypothetical protein
VNTAAAAAGQLSAEEYIGITMGESGVSEAETRVWEDRIQSVFTTGITGDVVEQFTTPAGPRYYHTRLVPERGPDGSVQ